MPAIGNRSWQYELYTQLPETPGIYSIYFEGDLRGYIGSAKNISKRIQTHLCEMQNSYHKMYRQFRERGPDDLCVAVLERVDNLDDLPEAETRWIKEFLDCGWELYNAELRGKTHRDRKASNER